MVIEPNKPTLGLRLIAVLEAVKGVLAVVVALMLFGLAGHRQNPIIQWVEVTFHLDDSARSPHLITEMLANPAEFAIGVWTMLALAYATLRFFEAYGLWLARRWAEWIALVAAAIYIPFEIYAIMLGVTLFKVSLLVINVAFVAYLGLVLAKTHRKRAHAARLAAAGVLGTPAGGN